MEPTHNYNGFSKVTGWMYVGSITLGLSYFLLQSILVLITSQTSRSEASYPIPLHITPFTKPYHPFKHHPQTPTQSNLSEF